MNLVLHAANMLDTSRPDRDAGICTRCGGQTKPSDQSFGNDNRHD